MITPLSQSVDSAVQKTVSDLSGNFCHLPILEFCDCTKPAKFSRLGNVGNNPSLQSTDSVVKISTDYGLKIIEFRVSNIRFVR